MRIIVKLSSQTEQAYPDFHELKTMTMHVARRHLRICQVHRRAIEGATGARMIVSSCDSIDASIIVSGSPKVVDAAIEALDGIIPANYEISCPITSNSQNGQKFVEGKEFRDVVNKIRSDLGIEVTASFQPSTSLLLTLTCTRASSQRIYQGLSLLSSLCEKHGFVISRDSTSILVPLETTNSTRPILARFPDLEAQATQPAALHGDTLRASSPANIFGGVSVSKPRSPSATQSTAMAKFPAPIGSRATIIEKASTIVVPDIFRISPTTPTDGKSSTVTTTFDRATEQITGYQGQTLDNAGAALTPRPEQENQIRSELMQTQSESTGDKDVVGQIGSRAHRRSRTSNGMTSAGACVRVFSEGIYHTWGFRYHLFNSFSSFQLRLLKSHLMGSATMSRICLFRIACYRALVAWKSETIRVGCCE